MCPFPRIECSLPPRKCCPQYSSSPLACQEAGKVALCGPFSLRAAVRHSPGVNSGGVRVSGKVSIRFPASRRRCHLGEGNVLLREYRKGGKRRGAAKRLRVACVCACACALFHVLPRRRDGQLGKSRKGKGKGRVTKLTQYFPVGEGRQKLTEQTDPVNLPAVNFIFGQCACAESTRFRRRPIFLLHFAWGQLHFQGASCYKSSHKKEEKEQARGTRHYCVRNVTRGFSTSLLRSPKLWRGG